MLAFSGCGERGLLLIALSTLIAAASPTVERRLWGALASVAVTHGLSCSEARGVVPDQGLIEHMSPALSGRFLCTVPPGEFHILDFKMFQFEFIFKFQLTGERLHT